MSIGGSGDADHYVVHLSDSTLRQSDGQPLTCADLRTGEQAEVRGFVNEDGSFGRAEVIVQT